MSLKKWLNDHNLAVSCFGVTAVVMVLNVMALGLYLSFTRLPYFTIENRFRDWVVQLGNPAPKDPRVYFLYDDAASHNLDQLWDEDFEASPILKKMKNKAWPREVYAAILERLAGAGASVVGFDYVFQAPVPESDPVWRAALDKYKDRVVIGLNLERPSVSTQRAYQLQAPAETLIPDVRDPRIGFINIWPDDDEIVRRFAYRLTLEQLIGQPAPPDATEYESLPVRMLRAAGEGDRIPNTRDFQMLRFSYRGETRKDMLRPQGVANIFIPSMWEANYQNGAFFKDKIVLVGPTGNLHKDVFNSPFGIIGGPEFHLNVINGLLASAFLHESPLWLDLLLIGVGGLLAFLGGWIVRNPIFRILLVAVLGAAFFHGAVWVFDHHNLVVEVFSPLVSLVGSSFLAIVWQQLVERLERAKMRKTFERYVSRDVVKELLDNPASYLNTIGGARKKVTVLFSDVRGFTTMTEGADAQTLVKQLNEYFDHMVNLVFANKGTLDKFIGDAVMAQWGGIYTEGEKEDAISAVRTAVQMRKRLAELNVQWVPRGMLELKFGIGVNHGEAIVGNLGCEAKMEVSLIGDAVNTASRLEGITKEYHNDLIIGETVEPFVRDTFHLRTVGLNQPKGKTVPLELFTVIDERAATPEPAWLPDHEEGVRLYRKREFAAAAACFEKVLAALPGDWLAGDYLEDCREFIQTPPPPDWNAVHIMKSK